MNLARGSRMFREHQLHHLDGRLGDGRHQVLKMRTPPSSDGRGLGHFYHDAAGTRKRRGPLVFSR
jgi:hypothetical protein